MKLAARIALALLLAFAPASADAQTPGQGDDKVVSVAGDDPEIAAAIEQARASLDDFLVLADARHPERPTSN
ncbi:hypothetical protein [Mesorhizobium sp. M0998]|uniref:hypothetical protein n=1 Tax=Mesorhizobium sp. M0998 TaxID=2957044 RepID=UPI00333AE184